jgi:hypothetical protein
MEPVQKECIHKLILMATILFRYAAVHLLAGIIVVGIASGLLVTLYLTLLLIAIVLNEGIGSLAALPLWLAIVATAAGLIWLTVFLPATAISDVVGRRKELSLQKKLMLAVCCYAGLILMWIALLPQPEELLDFGIRLAVSVVMIAILFFPMIGYWLFVQFSGWGMELVINIWKRLMAVPVPPAQFKPSARPLYLNPAQKKPPSH